MKKNVFLVVIILSLSSTLFAQADIHTGRVKRSEERLRASFDVKGEVSMSKPKDILTTATELKNQYGVVSGKLKVQAIQHSQNDRTGFTAELVVNDTVRETFRADDLLFNKYRDYPFTTRPIVKDQYGGIRATIRITGIWLGGNGAPDGSISIVGGQDATWIKIEEL